MAYFLYPANTSGEDGVDVPTCCIGWCLASIFYPCFVAWEYDKRKQVEAKLNGGPVQNNCPVMDIVLVRLCACSELFSRNETLSLHCLNSLGVCTRVQVYCCPCCTACQTQRAMQSYRFILKKAQLAAVNNPSSLPDETPDATGTSKED